MINGYSPMNINSLDINNFADEGTSNAFTFLLQALSKTTITQEALDNRPTNVSFSVMREGSLDVKQSNGSVKKLVGTTSDYVLQPVDLERKPTNNPRVNFFVYDNKKIINVYGQYYLNEYIGQVIYGNEETNTNEVTSVTVTYTDGELVKLASRWAEEITDADYDTKYWFTKENGWTDKYVLEYLELNSYPIVGSTIEVSLPGYSGDSQSNGLLEGK